MDFQRLKQLLFFKHKMNSITELLFCNKQHFHFEGPPYNERYFVFQIDNNLNPLLDLQKLDQSSMNPNHWCKQNQYDCYPTYRSPLLIKPNLKYSDLRKIHVDVGEVFHFFCHKYRCCSVWLVFVFYRVFLTKNLKKNFYAHGHF